MLCGQAFVAANMNTVKTTALCIIILMRLQFGIPHHHRSDLKQSLFLNGTLARLGLTSVPRPMSGSEVRLNDYLLYVYNFLERQSAIDITDPEPEVRGRNPIYTDVFKGTIAFNQSVLTTSPHLDIAQLILYLRRGAHYYLNRVRYLDLEITAVSPSFGSYPLCGTRIDITTKFIMCNITDAFKTLNKLQLTKNNLNDVLLIKLRANNRCAVKHLVDLTIHHAHSPLIVSYFHFKNHTLSKLLSSALTFSRFGGNRTGQMVRKRRQLPYELPDSVILPTPRNADHECRVHPWEVDFVELGWAQILRPLKYRANFCLGDCPYPLTAKRFNASNYAFVKSMYKIIKGLRNTKHVPTAQCTPTTFEPMNMLYDNGGEIVLKTVLNMVVKACSCN